MFFLFFYLLTLIVGPQFWIEPFVGWRVDVFTYPLWFLWLLLTGRGPKLFRLSHQDWFFLGMVAWIYLTCILNPLNNLTALHLFNYPKWFVLYRLVVATLPTLLHVRWAMLIYLFFALIISVESIQHGLDDDMLGWAGQGLDWVTDEAAAWGWRGRTAWVGQFDGPGVFCVIFTIALPMAMQYIGRPFPAWKWPIGIVLLGLVLGATWYTGSRGGFLASVGVVGLYIALRMGITLPRLALAGALGASLLLVAPSYLTSTRDSHRSAQHRVDAWAKGMEMVAQSPVFGIGKGNYARFTGRIIAHNSPMEIVGETGLPGLFLWLGIIYMGFKSLVIAYRAAPDPIDRSYLAALGLAVTGYLMSALFVTLEYETLYFLFALMSAVGHTLNPPPRMERREFWYAAGLIAAYLLAMKIFLMLYY